MTIGEKISIQRKIKNIKQNVLAANLGKEQSFVSDLETNKISPTWDILQKISSILEVSILDLLPVNPSNVFNNSENEVVNNITNKFNDNIEQERKLWQNVIDSKNEIITELKFVIEFLKNPQP